MYYWLKLLHVLAVIAWLGGALALNVTSMRLAREKNQAALAALLGQAAFYGRTVIGPMSVLTLASGIGMVAVSGLTFGTFWVSWGMFSIAAHFVLGTTLIRSTGRKLGEAAGQAQPDLLRVAVLRRRLAVLNSVYWLLMLSVISAMVMKPTI